MALSRTSRISASPDPSLTGSDQELGQLSPTTRQKLCLMTHHGGSRDGLSPDSEPSPARDLLTGKDRALHEPDALFDILEYAEKFFNDHERDAGGTIMKSLKKRGRQSSFNVSRNCWKEIGCFYLYVIFNVCKYYDFYSFFVFCVSI